MARGLARSRAQAQALLLAGRVVVEGLAAPKAGALVHEAVRVTLKESPPFVSRGGEKLAGALEHFAVSPAGKVALDTGACHRGLHPLPPHPGGPGESMPWTWVTGNRPEPQNDPRVTVLKRVNIRHLPNQPSPSPSTWPPWICLSFP